MINQSTVSPIKTPENLRVLILSYVNSCIDAKRLDKKNPEVSAHANEIVDDIMDHGKKEFLSLTTIKGICARIHTKHKKLDLPYATYLHCFAMLFYYTTWQSLVRASMGHKEELVTNNHHHLFTARIGAPFPPLRETNIPNAKGLSTLAKGTHVTWQSLRKILRKLSIEDMHPAIDSLLLEMQMAVGITAANDPRGDMIFAVFHDPNVENGYLILGEKYRPKAETSGSYRTVMVRVKTYPLSNRIMSISVPKDNCYSEISIKTAVEALKIFKVAGDK